MVRPRPCYIQQFSSQTGIQSETDFSKTKQMKNKICMKLLESIHSTALKKRVRVCVRAGVYVCEVVDILGTWKHKVRKVQGHLWSL